MLEIPYKERLEKILSHRKDPLCGLRTRAWERAWEMGAPGTSAESFKKVLLSQLYQRDFVEKRVELLDVAPFIRPEMYQIVFINGRFCPHLSSLNDLKPCVILPIEDAFLRYGIFLQNRIHHTIKNENNFFPLITEALQESGMFLYLPPGTKIDKKVQLLQLFTGERTHSFPRVQATIGSGSEIALESEQIFLGSEVVVNALFDLVIEQDARFSMQEIALPKPDSIVMNHVRAAMRKDSTLNFFCATSGSKLCRNDIAVELLEIGASAHLKGVWNVSGDNRAHTEIRVAHRAPSAFSHQHFKGIVQGRGTSTFEGKIFVAPEAQQTVSYQLNNNLILDQGATAYSKPNLEIFADDVKASHGATIAEVSDEEMFYLQARGISSDLAKRILVKGFLDSLLKEAASPYIREAFDAL